MEGAERRKGHRQRTGQKQASNRGSDKETEYEFRSHISPLFLMWLWWSDSSAGCDWVSLTLERSGLSPDRLGLVSDCAAREG